MHRTQKNHLRCDKHTYRLLRLLTLLSTNLYSVILYTVRLHYFNNGHAYRMHERTVVKHDENYNRLHSQVARQVMKAVDRAMKAFFHLLKERKRRNYHRPSVRAG